MVAIKRSIWQTPKNLPHLIRLTSAEGDEEKKNWGNKRDLIFDFGNKKRCKYSSIPKRKPFFLDMV